MKSNLVYSIRALVAAGLLVTASLGHVVAAEQNDLNDSQWIERMQSHWEKVVKEDDPQKRQELLREHEQMMVQAAGSESGQTPRQSSPSAHGMDSSHVDMMNTVDMHRHMMDMMR